MDCEVSTLDVTQDRAPIHWSQACLWLYAGTLGVAIVEWMMLELLRTPYGPPEDVLTFLGQEKYDLVAVMCCIAGVWSLTTIGIFFFASLTLRNYLSFIALLAAICSGFVYIIFVPHRPVTPWEMIWM